MNKSLNNHLFTPERLLLLNLATRANTNDIDILIYQLFFKEVSKEFDILLENNILFRWSCDKCTFDE